MTTVKKFWWCLGVAVMVAMPSVARGQVQHLPISAFIDAQSANVYAPWFDPKSDAWLLYDAFGKRAGAFGLDVGTTFEGRVTVRPLASGKAHVSVVLHTKSALCWGFQGAPSLATLAFGYRPLDVFNGAPAALGDGLTKFEFLMPSPDSPLPNYFTQLGGDDYPLKSIVTSVSCAGVLHAPSGYEEGTPGMARTTQTGLYATGVPDGCPPEQDASCFPAEVVDFHPIGN